MSRLLERCLAPVVPSWLNQVERWFGAHGRCKRSRLRIAWVCVFWWPFVSPVVDVAGALRRRGART